MTNICSNPWCKATFLYKEEECEVINGDLVPPSVCPKCKSFDNELSGGVKWVDKEYPGPRFDNSPHEMRYKINKYF